MSVPTPELWPFGPAATLLPEHWRQWYERCYVRSQVDTLLADPNRSVVVISHAGCGATTSLSLIEQSDLLCFNYNPDQWPGKAKPFSSASDHFGQWMALVSDCFVVRLREQPELAAKLSLPNYEFLLWLKRHYLTRRQADSLLYWLQTVLPQEHWQQLSAKFNQGDLDNLYDDTVSALYGQIDECLDIARQLGWSGIYASIDISWADWMSYELSDKNRLAADVKQILTTLTPLQRAGFGLKMALPSALFSIQDVRDMLRGRAVITTYEWSPAALHQIALNLIDLASAEMVDAQALLPTQLWQDLDSDLRSIWGKPGPGAAAALAQQIVTLATQKKSPATHLSELREQLYRQFAQLRMDSNRSRCVVWRGVHAIELDETPFRFFEMLWRHRGEAVSNEALLEIAGSKANLDKNISRVRSEIEPLYTQKVYIYVQRRSAGGTWLDKETCLFP